MAAWIVTQHPRWYQRNRFSIRGIIQEPIISDPHERHIMSHWLPHLLIFLAVTPAEPPQPEFQMEWGRKGDAPGQFHSPIGLAFTSDEKLVVTDLNNARVQVFSTESQFLSQFELPRDKPERKSTIIGGIAIDRHDLIFLSFMMQNKIAVYRLNGELVREWGTQGGEPGQLNQPGGMVFVGDEELLVADQCNHRIQRFTTAGKFVSTWGKYGTEPGQFDGIGTQGSRFGGPHFLALDTDGDLYTTEGIAGRVQRLTVVGKPVAHWGNKTDEPGGFGAYQFSTLTESFGPVGIAVDRHDRVFVSSLNNRVQVFDRHGKFLFGIHETGQPGGELLHPHGMAFDAANCLYIADAGNQRIVKFRLPPVK